MPVTPKAMLIQPLIRSAKDYFLLPAKRNAPSALPEMQAGKNIGGQFTFSDGEKQQRHIVQLNK